MDKNHQTHEEKTYHKNEKLLKDQNSQSKKYFKLLSKKAVYYSVLLALILLILFVLFSSL